MSGSIPPKKYEFRIKLGQQTQKIVVEADFGTTAKAMVEAQYGKQAIVWGPAPASSIGRGTRSVSE